MMKTILLMAAILVIACWPAPGQGKTSTRPCPYRPDGSCYEVVDSQGRVIETIKKTPYDPNKWETKPNPGYPKPTPRATGHEAK
jgi:hypothetical protein